MLRRLIFLECAALAFAPFAAQGATSKVTRQIVIPGRSVGALVLGMSREAVWQHYGRPLSSYTCSDGMRVDSFTDGIGMAVLYRNSRVVQINVAQPQYRAVDGLSVKSTFADIRPYSRHWRVRLFASKIETGGILLVDDEQHGLAFGLGMVHLDNFPVSDLPHLAPDLLIIHRHGVAVLAVSDGCWLTKAPDGSGEADWPLAVRTWFAAASALRKK